jgi:hypothetical protein
MEVRMQGQNGTIRRSDNRFYNFCKFLGALSSLFLFTIFQPAAYADQTSISWDPPTINADGTPITDLSGYKVHYGTSSGKYTQTINAGNETSYTVANLNAGNTYYFAVTAYDRSFNESGYSPEVSKTIPVQPYTLSVYRGGTGSGNVTSSPNGIICGSNCAAAYNSGTVVTLTAAPDGGSIFAGWSGVCSGTGSCTVTMNAAKAVTATFILKTYTINASADTGGNISPSGSIPVCHDANQSFTITADTGYSIADVLVDGQSVRAVATYTFSNVTAPHTISVSLSAKNHSLSVTKSGTGAGVVTSSPSGINCGSDCSVEYSADTSVTLTVSPDDKSTFTGWSGACNSKYTCTVSMDAAKSVTANFAMKTYIINATSGTGGGLSPSGSVKVNHGTNQTFTISTDTGYRIADVLVDGQSAGAVSFYTFSNVAATHTIEANFSVDTLPQETIIDNGNPGTFYTGTWDVSGGTNPYDLNSLWSRDGATYTWQFAPEPAGTYEVYMWWSGWSSRATNVPVTITHSGGTSTMRINQRQNAGKWNSLGQYHFDSNGSVTITAANGTTVSTCADAVWFKYIPEASQTIIDNREAAAAITGTWDVSGASNFYGTDSVWSRDGSTFTWNFTPAESEFYDVSMWWTTWSSRGVNVPVDIQYSGGTARVYINQQLNGGKWNNLGTYRFEAGKTYKVTITAQPGPSSTCADAVKFDLR